MATPLIPRADLFGNPKEAGTQISPDGLHLSWLAPENGVLNVWVAPRADLTAAKPVTHERARGIHHHVWAQDARHLLYLQDHAGDENFHVYAVDVNDGQTRDLTPIDGVSAHIAHVSRDLPGAVLLAINDRDRRFHDLVRVDLATGRRETVLINEGFAGILVDEQFKPRVAVHSEVDGAHMVHRRIDERWQPWFRFDAEDARLSRPAFVDRDGTAIYCIDSRHRDTTALTRIDLASSEMKVLAEPAESGVGVALVDHESHAPAVCVFNRERPRYVALDRRLQLDLDRIAAHGLDIWGLTSRTKDDDVWMIGASSDVKPGATYLYDRATGSIETIHRSRPQLETAPLAVLRPLTIQSRDGLDLVCYLTRPREAQEGVAGPMVLLVHGGPWSRDAFGYHPYHQWLANRGYSVLSVNFRGSTGFGKAFVNAGDGEWGRRMDDDLLDAVAWAVKMKIADPARIAIMGTSYGGYATLVGLTRNPDTYACGIDVVGPANLETLLRTIPPYWETFKAQLHKGVGDPNTEAGLKLMRERSPVYAASRIRKPLLVAQGANDPRVKRAESDQMVAAIQANGIPVTYLLFPDEGHGLARPQNHIAFIAIAEMFLAKNLGGDSVPMGKDELAASTVEVLASDLPELPAKG